MREFTRPPFYQCVRVYQLLIEPVDQHFLSSVISYIPAKIGAIGSPLWEFYLRWFTPTHRTESTNTFNNTFPAKELVNTSSFSMDSQRSSISLRATSPSVHSASSSLAQCALCCGLEVDSVGMQSVGHSITPGTTAVTDMHHPSIRRRALNR